MDVSRQFWAIFGAGGLLAILGIAFERPVLLLGTAGTWGLLAALQLWFLRQLFALDAKLAIDQSIEPTVVTKGQRVSCYLEAGLSSSTPLVVTISPNPPVSATIERRPALSVSKRDEPARREYTAEMRSVGTTRFRPPTVVITDPYGLFSERLSRGPAVTVTVDSERPSDVHVGQGGETAVTMPGGQHRTGRLGTGIDPAELREYIPGDTVRNIDWKATARLDTPHVREYDVETDRRTLLLFDQRSKVATGPPGETKLAYLRDVALTVFEAARTAGDPVGLYAVGDHGLTVDITPETDTRTSDRIRTHLLDATATDPEKGGPSSEDRPRNTDTVSSARRKATVLADGSDPFARTLQPYFATADRYVRRIEDEPLYRSARRWLSRSTGDAWMVLLSDDRNREELRETVKLARRGGNHVIVFMTPTVLFESGTLADAERAYQKYLDFETFRRDLATLDRVDTFEVGPEDRVAALLSTRRTQRG